MSSLYFGGVTWSFPLAPQQDQGTGRIRGRCVTRLSNCGYATLEPSTGRRAESRRHPERPAQGARAPAAVAGVPPEAAVREKAF